MKRTIIGIVLGLILGSTITVFASESVLNKVEATIMDIKLSLNGDVVELENKPLVYNQRTYLPVREISELLKLEVGWDQGNQMVTLNNILTNEGDDIKPVKNNNELNQIFYNINEVNNYLANKYGLENTILGTVRDNVMIKKYQGKEYPVNDHVDFYYDGKNDIQYFTKDYFLQFLNPEDLESLPKYSIDRELNNIHPIN